MDKANKVQKPKADYDGIHLCAQCKKAFYPKANRNGTP